MVQPIWMNSRELQDQLVRQGWHTPDTYGNIFRPLSDISAVYLFLVMDLNCGFRKSFVGYVGKSSRLIVRLKKHPIYEQIFSTGNLWPMRWFLPCPPEILWILERGLITKFNPPWNVSGRRRGIS
jgi:hypothetical protein